jgi:hypothetical protein
MIGRAGHQASNLKRQASRAGCATRRPLALIGLSLTALLAGCGAPPPPPAVPPEPQPAYILEGKIYGVRNHPEPGITVYLFPVGSSEPLGFTRSDSTGSYRIELWDQKPDGRMLVILNSNRHPDHNSRYLNTMDRIAPLEGGNRDHHLYYLTPSSEGPPTKGEVYVLKDLCNVRAAPDTESPVVTQVKKGQALEYLERDGDWIWIETRDGTRGWIYRMLVTTLDHRMPE